MPPPDRGPREVRRLRQVTTGRTDLEIDPLSLLFARDFIDEAAYLAGRKYSATVSIARYAMGLPQGSVSGLWARLVAGTDTPAYGQPLRSDEAPDSCEGARLWVERMNAELQRRGETAEILQTVVSIAIDRRWEGWCKRVLTRLRTVEGDWRSLGYLRTGLQRLAELRPDRARVSSEHAEAAE
jgi:hypothetical protein